MRIHRRLVCLVAILFAAAAGAQTAPALFVVHFETGPAWNKALAPSEQPGFKEHSANLNRLRKEGLIKFGARYGASE